MKKIIPLIPLILIFLSIDGVISCSFILPEYYLTNLHLTTDPDILLVEIYTENRTLKKEITINLQNLSLISDTQLEGNVSFEPIADTQKYQSNLTTTPQNQIHWKLLAENGTVLINATLPKINTTFNLFSHYFVNPSLRRGYMVLYDDRFFFNNATVFTITFNSNEIRKSIVLWVTSEEPVTVFPQEGLLKKRAGCCYCVSEYYYRFSLDHGLEYLTKTYVWSSTVLDLRIKRIIMVHSINNKVEVIDYNLTQPVRKRSTRFNESELEYFIKNQSSSSYTPQLYALDILISGVIIFVIKKHSQKWKKLRL